MLITTNKNIAGTQAKYEGDKIVTVHAENVSELLKANYEKRKDRNNGFTDLRTMREVMEINTTAYLAMLKKYPDLVDPITGVMDKKKFQKVKWDPDFQPFLTVDKGI